MKYYSTIVYFILINISVCEEVGLGGLKGVLVSGQIAEDKIDGRVVFILDSGRTFIANKALIKKDQKSVIFFGGAIVIDSTKGEVRRATEADGYVIVDQNERERYVGGWELIELKLPLKNK